jgi:hypothetical protein
MTKKEIIKLVNETEKAIAIHSDSFLLSINSMGKNLYDELYDFLSRLDMSKGRFVWDESSYALFATLKRNVDSISKKAGGYGKSYQNLLTGFTHLDRVIKRQQKKLNNVTISDNYIKDKTGGFIKKTIAGFNSSNYNVNIVQPTIDGLFNRVYNGASLEDTRVFLKRNLVGTAKNGSKLSNYAEQQARDTLHQYNGQINQKIAEDYNLDGIYYENNLIDDSRPQCVRWKTKYNGLLKRSILREEIAWAENYGRGMIPNTTPQNFMINRGGYNCRHSAIPVNYAKYKKINSLNLK